MLTSASAGSGEPKDSLHDDERPLISLVPSKCNSLITDDKFLKHIPTEFKSVELEEGIFTVSSNISLHLNPTQLYGEAQRSPTLKTGLHFSPRRTLMGPVRGEHIDKLQTAPFEAVEESQLPATDTLKWLLTQSEEPSAYTSMARTEGNCSNITSSSETLLYMQSISSGLHSISAGISKCRGQDQLMIPAFQLDNYSREGKSVDFNAGSTVIDVDHPAAAAASHVADSNTAGSEGPMIMSPADLHLHAEVLNASTKALCIKGWQRFCGAHLDITPPRAARQLLQDEAGRPARVSAVHRQIVMISSGDPDLHHECSENNSTDASHHEVCLELNIGPSKLGFPLSAGCRKTLKDIHSGEISGFSKWRRPAADQPKEKLHDVQAHLQAYNTQSVQCPCNSPGILFEKLESSKDISHSFDGQYSSPDHELVTFCLDSDKYRYQSQLSSEYSGIHAIDDTLMSVAQTCKDTNMHSVSTHHTAVNRGTATSDPKFLGMLTNSSRDPFSHKKDQCSASNKSCLYETLGVCAEDAIELMPNSLLLQAAFPSHEIPSSISTSCKSPKLNSLQSPSRPVVRDPSASEQTLYISRSYSNMIRSLDNIPNVQEKSLVEFLHAKKHHKEHFLDKVVVKEDVYQSHPWHFASGDQQLGGGKWNGGAYSAGAAGGSSLYFCCSTKYTKRGNMTRNRMTKEGGRWKQQGMVQPIFYGHTSGAGEQQLVEAAHKTYLSYIPRGSCSTSAWSSSYFVNSSQLDRRPEQRRSDAPSADASCQYVYNSGRLKHRHRMIEIALQEDLLLEKRSFQLKISPKPFLVVCILRNSS
ncbi:hypothetical protein GOP47_0000843 [Adiantum capillus-veneris]|uniref:NAC domain-containing protein n=1 Tax=Adiantum capillus-veneris TaxID=13818 RepID=A0A9D4VE22_ADICA|nr:hypothetical protein GOP47_0000843 [Adiantum capillus-veneris]